MVLRNNMAFLIGILLISSIKHNSLEAKEEVRAVFISYIELSEYVKANSIDESKKNINKIYNPICIWDKLFLFLIGLGTNPQ